MKIILQINVTANWGSTGKISEAIGDVALANGWESYIAYGRWCNPSKSQLIKVGSFWDKYFHFLEQRVRDNEGLCSRKATNRLIHCIEEIKPDVVQLHNLHDHYLNYLRLFEYLNRADIKVVWTFHDCWAFTGHCFHFVKKDCQKWKTGCYKCPMKNVQPKTLVDRSRKNYELKMRLFSECKHLTIVPCSDWLAGFVRQSFLKDKRIEVIKNGVNLELFKPQERNERSQGHDILAVSSVWNEEKGLYDILKLRERLPAKYSITIVGVTARQRGQLPTGIIGIERTQSVQELVQLYSDSDVLINPTYADTFPTVNLEALACGTPVITYRTGGSPEALDENTGVVVERGDVEGMAEAVIFVCGKDRKQYAMACRKRAEENFDKDICFEKYMELYKGLTSN